ncbi:hypothetical protein GCM10011487_27050 [Steroidobacter agaridevorans]|uniref:Lipopolysaccharide assembly protein A domain-containing protein n=1 Tax=Steroidobacter agaridevorans TaxID=2695856 RepID=A0A829YBZ6_9GAMM|nr:LapA family protein [Steroidobacter agaridevorans]GFE80705.1 hypothetical protein GCM10011487_27050 [Steroidobacter agaridevorans]
MRIIALVVVAVFAVIFAIQNTDVATVSLLWWQVRASLAVIMILCLSMGLLVGLAVLAPLLYRRRNATRELQSRLAAMEANDIERKARTSHVPFDGAPATHPDGR